MMRFSIETDGAGKKEINMALSHDINLVTAHPCVVSPHPELLKSPTSPSFPILEQTQPESSGRSTGMLHIRCSRVSLLIKMYMSIELTHSPGHPLHKAFTYTKMSLSDILASPAKLSFSALLSSPQSPTVDPAQSNTHPISSTIPKVLVIDCADSTTDSFPPHPAPSAHSKHHFGSDLEMLARALCSERGWNALISRRGRGCLACAVREAGALGWRVILRFA